METREKEFKIKQWFDMWLCGKCYAIDDIFCDDAVYIESWGPEYKGLSEIKHWFNEWNTRGKVIVWDIKQYFHKDDQTVVEWCFSNSMNDGRKENFDGISLIRWKQKKICCLKEFGCNINNYNPYENGDKPVFRKEKINWF